MSRILPAFLLFGVGVWGGGGWSQPDATQKAAKKARQGTAPKALPQPVAQPEKSGPLSLYDVLYLLIEVPSLRSTLADVVNKRGVDFKADAELRAYLKEKGASEELLDLLPQPPAPPKPKTAGPLTVLCAPRDCDVVVNDSYYGATEKGRKEVTGLPAGENKVRVYADGHDTGARILNIKEYEAREVKFALKHNSEIERLEASARLLEVLAGLGGMNSMIQLASGQATGSVEYSFNGGSATRWKMQASRSGTGLSLTFQNPDGKCTMLWSGDSGTSECKGKVRKTSAYKELGKVAENYDSYQLPVVLGRMLAGKISIEGPQRSILKSEVSGASYSLELTQDALPAKLELQSADKGIVRVAYLDYQKIGEAKQPRRLEFTRGDESKPFLMVLLDAGTTAEPGRSRR